MMVACNILIANLTPFCSSSANAGSLIELGWFLGRGRPTFGYSNSAESFKERRRRYTAVIPDPLAALSIEDFGLPDNLMIPGTVLSGGGYPIILPLDNQDRPFDALDVFEKCVQIAASKMGLQRP